MFNKIQKLASAVKNNVLSGLSGLHTSTSLSDELLEDTVVREMIMVIKDFFNKGVLNVKDLYLAINCISIDCNTPIEKCSCTDIESCEPNPPHFEIPQIILDLGDKAISYIGAVDKLLPFIWYTSPTALKRHKYRKRSKNKPVVWIDTTPNKNGRYDCFLFNAPLVNTISIVAAFKDLRQLKEYICCENLNDDNLSIIDSEVIERTSKKILTYYRLMYMPPRPNDQSYTPS